MEAYTGELKHGKLFWAELTAFTKIPEIGKNEIFNELNG